MKAIKALIIILVLTLSMNSLADNKLPPPVPEHECKYKKVKTDEGERNCGQGDCREWSPYFFGVCLFYKTKKQTWIEYTPTCSCGDTLPAYKQFGECKQVD